MKLGVISDIHGDPAALELAWERLSMLGADQIVCAGDVVGYGPDPDAAVSFLKERQVPTVRGNHDRWALRRPAGTPDEFGGAGPGPESREFLDRLPPMILFKVAGRSGLLAHGSPYSDMEFVTRRTHPPGILSEYLKEFDAELLIVGHTHQPMWYLCDQGLVVNPGSVISLPVVRSSRSFALIDLEDLSVTFHEVESGRTIALAPWSDAAEDA